MLEKSQAFEEPSPTHGARRAATLLRNDEINPGGGDGQRGLQSGAGRAEELEIIGVASADGAASDEMICSLEQRTGERVQLDDVHAGEIPG